MTRVLVVAAHPDDEVLGAGATIARHTRQGDVVQCLLLADGVTARGDDANREVRARAAQAAANVLGVARIEQCRFPDNRMDSVDLLDVVQAVESVVDSFEPQVIYTHHGGDLNIDHAITHRAVLTACRPLPGSTVQSIYGFEVLSSTEWSSPEQAEAFRPVHFVDIELTLDTKLEALNCYIDELRDAPHPRSVEVVRALATLRGSQAGFQAAEAFTVVRQLSPSEPV